MLRFTPNDDTYNHYKDEFWFELVILSLHGDLNDELKNHSPGISAERLHQQYAEMARLRDIVNDQLSPQHRAMVRANLQARIPNQGLTNSGLDTYDHLLQAGLRHVFSEDPVSFYLFLSHPSTNMPAENLPELMNKSLGHCHAVLSVDRVIDPILNALPVFRYHQTSEDGEFREFPGVISEDFLNLVQGLNEASFTHLLRIEKTRTKLEEIYTHFPSELPHSWQRTMLEESIAARQEREETYYIR